MHLFKASSADEAWRSAARALRQQKVDREKITPSLSRVRGGNAVKEMCHVAFTIRDPRQRLVFGHAFNPAYAIVEVIWMLSGSNDVEFLRFWNPRMRHFSDDGSSLHGAYGHRLGSAPPLSADARKGARVHGRKKEPDQLRVAYEALKRYPKIRQVVLQIWDKRIDLPDPGPRSKDVPCNIMSHLMIRDGKLEWLQVMRANDLVWGTPVNFIQFTVLQEIMAGWLGIDVGSYVHISDNLIAFERCFENIDIIRARPSRRLRTSDLRVRSYDDWAVIWNELVLTVQYFAQTAGSDEIQRRVQQCALPPAYSEWVSLLAAEALLRRSCVSEAYEMIEGAGDYWRESWVRWAGVYRNRSMT